MPNHDGDNATRRDQEQPSETDVNPKDRETPAAPAEPRKKPRASKRAATADGESNANGGTRTPRRRKPAKPKLALPVVITDETVLLPHMSIPFPIEDDETARAIDRAMRMTPRLVLLLTERPVEGNDATIETGKPERDLIDMMTDLMATEAGLDDDADDGLGEPVDVPWDTSNEPQVQYELCNVGVIAEVGQYISRPGGQDHVILQGITRGVAEELIQDEPFVAARVRREDATPGEPART